METKTSLYKAIISVMKAVKGIDKTLTVGSGNNSYKGVADKAVKEIIGKAMEENGLAVLPIAIEPKLTIERWEEATTYNNQPQIKMRQSVFTEVTTKYLLIHESGESIEIVGYGHGVDTQDKAAGKATTYALKYALLYAFMVPTGKIEDADNHHSDESDIPQNNTQIVPPSRNANGKVKDQKEPEKWLNADSEEWKALVKSISGGATFTLAQIKKKYKVSAETAKELESLNVF